MVFIENIGVQTNVRLQLYHQKQPRNYKYKILFIYKWVNFVHDVHDILGILGIIRKNNILDIIGKNDILNGALVKRDIKAVGTIVSAVVIIKGEGARKIEVRRRRNSECSCIKCSNKR